MRVTAVRDEEGQNDGPRLRYCPVLIFLMFPIDFSYEYRLSETPKAINFRILLNVREQQQYFLVKSFVFCVRVYT